MWIRGEGGCSSASSLQTTDLPLSIRRSTRLPFADPPGATSPDAEERSRRAASLSRCWALCASTWR